MTTNSYSPARITEVRHQVQTALEQALISGQSGPTIDALRASLEVLTELASPLRMTAVRHAGTIEYTLEDEECPPHGRQVDVRVYYRWEDYDPADEPYAVWGAQIEDVEVLAVRYCDEDGEAVDLATHHRQLALELLDQQRDQVTEACTDDGVRRGVGEAHPLHRTAPLPQATGNARRMAPSQRTRDAAPQQRKFG